MLLSDPATDSDYVHEALNARFAHEDNDDIESEEEYAELPPYQRWQEPVPRGWQTPESKNGAPYPSVFYSETVISAEMAASDAAGPEWWNHPWHEYWLEDPDSGIVSDSVATGVARLYAILLAENDKDLPITYHMPDGNRRFASTADVRKYIKLVKHVAHAVTEEGWEDQYYDFGQEPTPYDETIAARLDALTEADIQAIADGKRELIEFDDDGRAAPLAATAAIGSNQL
jgi:hypothetical protein